MSIVCTLMKYFNSRHPCGWRRYLSNVWVRIKIFQLTPPMWVATPTVPDFHLMVGISTHTTHVGGDLKRDFRKRPHRYFNSHHPCGWRQANIPVVSGIVNISTHTTHVGGDFFDKVAGANDRIFQLTPPMWVATIRFLQPRHPRFYFNSPHPCGWRPDSIVTAVCKQRHFNSHHPCGWRLSIKSRLPPKLLFQLTPPMWVATAISDKNISETAYYIHRSLQKTSKRHQY